MTRYIFPLLVLTAVLLVAGCNGDEEFTREGELRFVRGDETIARIDIEIADDQQQRTRGLMYRQHMAENHGMLFIFEREEPRRFWMKNTHISLDILFVSAQGEILHIEENTTPYSKRGVACSQDAMYVVEVNAGYTAAHGLHAGDGIVWERSDD